jgi:hypothetical protein
VYVVSKSNNAKELEEYCPECALLQKKWGFYLYSRMPQKLSVNSDYKLF